MTTTTERPLPTRNPIFIDDTPTIDTTSVSPNRLVSPVAQRFGEQPLPQHGSHSIVMRAAETHDLDAWQKLYWGVSNQVLVTHGYVLSIEVSVDQLGLPTDAIASESSWPLLWNQPYSSIRSRPGVVFITHQRHKIFEERLVLHTASLPWWRPQITLDRRRIEKKHD